MFLKDRSNHDLVEVLTLKELFAPYHGEVVGRYQQGEELQDPEKFKKSDLLFPSGEELPRCWIDPHYRDEKSFK
ncbi:MAG: hypothetical protein MRK01_17465 [Candidatus Scalindua sp.]|nr:hypothetical protein [Candidatus Scalindua sp.]